MPLKGRVFQPPQLQASTTLVDSKALGSLRRALDETLPPSNSGSAPTVFDAINWSDCFGQPNQRIASRWGHQFLGVRQFERGKTMHPLLRTPNSSESRINHAWPKSTQQTRFSRHSPEIGGLERNAEEHTEHFIDQRQIVIAAHRDSVIPCASDAASLNEQHSPFGRYPPKSICRVPLSHGPPETFG